MQPRIDFQLNAGHDPQLADTHTAIATSYLTYWVCSFIRPHTSRTLSIWFSVLRQCVCYEVYSALDKAPTSLILSIINWSVGA